MNLPKRHHTVPRFYLAGFTQGGSDDSHLEVFDLEAGVWRKGSPKNEGVRKGFYEIAGEDPAYIEKSFSIIESEIARIIRDISASHALPSKDEDLGCLIHWVALQAARVVSTRKMMEGFVADVGNRLMDEATHDDETFAKVISNLDPEVREEVSEFTREELREANDAATLEMDNTTLVKWTLELASGSAEPLYRRNWGIAVSEKGTPDFVTSDAPVGVAPVGHSPRPVGFATPGSARSKSPRDKQPVLIAVGEGA